MPRPVGLLSTYMRRAVGAVGAVTYPSCRASILRETLNCGQCTSDRPGTRGLRGSQSPAEPSAPRRRGSVHAGSIELCQEQ